MLLLQLATSSASMAASHMLIFALEVPCVIAWQVIDDVKLLKAIVYEAQHGFSNVFGVASR
jgi:hypothetical protein